MLVALLIGAALAVSLNVQSLNSPLAGAWLLFFLAGCAASYRTEKHRPIVWWSCVAWLAVLGISTFILRPVANGAATMWMLESLPLTTVSLRKEHLRAVMIAALVVLTIYAAGLVAQLLLHVRYTNFENWIPKRGSFAYAWPLLDPNNAACVLNFGLIPCFSLALRKWFWWGMVTIFAVAMYATASKAGCIAAVIGCGILLIDHFRKYERVMALLGVCALMTGLQLSANAVEAWHWFKPYLDTRPAIWEACWRMIQGEPWRGYGLGTFATYYQYFRSEIETGGYFAHNDILQFAIEMGVPMTLVFCFLCVSLAVTTRRYNIVPAAVMLAVFLQAMVEFQFYLPSIGILMGLAIAYHSSLRLTYKARNNIMR